jgi:hypothetical protein
VQHVLKYDTYNEILENQKEKEDRLTAIENQMKTLISILGNTKDQNQVNSFAQQLFDTGIIKAANK